MTPEDLFDAVQLLVRAGEYLDSIPAMPAPNLPGAAFHLDGRPMLIRGSTEHAEARAAGLVERLPPLTPATLDAVEEVEVLLDQPLPSLLRRLYLELGNGGFGPGYGILGLRGGHADSSQKTAVDLYRETRSGSLEAWRSVPSGLLPLCDWGCGITSFVDCRDARMWAWDPNPIPPADESDALFRDTVDLAEWLARWVDGRLHQPALVQDPQTGEWRGATDEEYAAWLA